MIETTCKINNLFQSTNQSILVL